MDKTFEDRMLKHMALVMSVPELTQWSIHIFSTVFGNQVKQYMWDRFFIGTLEEGGVKASVYDSQQSKILGETLAARHWLNLRKENRINFNVWKDVVLSNNSWWSEDREGLMLDYLIKANAIWEERLYDAVYSSGGLAIVSGVISEPMMPYRADWDTLFPDWYPGSSYMFPLTINVGVFGGLKYKWVVLLVPVLLTPVVDTILSIRGHIVPLPIDGDLFEEKFNLISGNERLQTEIALSLPSTADAEEVVLTSMKVSKMFYSNLN